MRRDSRWWRAVAIWGAAPVAIGTALTTASVNGHAAAAGGAVGNVAYLGDSTPSGGSGGSAGGASDATAPNMDHPTTPTKPVTSPLSDPSPQRTAVSSSAGSSQGFAGLDHFDQRTAGTGQYINTQFSLEPPDQGLCVGNGFVLESVNLAMAVYTPSGTSLTGPVALNQFYKRSPGINRTTLVRGDFLSDPKCYFDTATGRWFQTVLEVDAPGGFPGKNRSHVLIAVSKTGDPTGSWRLFSLDTTDDGQKDTPAHTGCPCLPDQPLIGANHEGFFISTNEFQGSSPATPFNGAQIYAMSKTGLEHSSGTQQVVHINTGTIPTGDAALPFWGSIQPAASPTTGSQSHNVEFLLSTAPMDINQNNTALDNRIVVWALTGTESLNDSSPDVELVHHVMHSETYGPGVNLSGGELFSAPQESGPTPFRDTFATGQPLERLNANDSRMNQVVYADGKLFGAVNTVVTSDGSNSVGIAYFVVEPNVDDGGVQGSIDRQGYLAAKGANVMFPSIGVTAGGNGIMTFTLVGTNTFPSAAFVAFDENGATGPIHTIRKGVGPEDGFTGYNTIFFGGNGVARWGDYSAAVATPDGQVWMADEYIGQACTTAQYTADSTCGGTRTTIANWGTFVSHINAGDREGGG